MVFNQRGRGRGSVFSTVSHDAFNQQQQGFQAQGFQAQGFQAQGFQTQGFQPQSFQPQSFQLQGFQQRQPFQQQQQQQQQQPQQHHQQQSMFRNPNTKQRGRGRNNNNSNHFDASLNEALGQSSFGQPQEKNHTPKPTFSFITPTKKKPFQPKKASPMLVDDTDKQSRVTAADRAQRFGSTSKSADYDRMKKNRVAERQQAIEDGLIPDPNAPVRLEDAIDFRGTCEAKCPDFEILEREIQNGLDALEMDTFGNADKNRVVKAYRRSAAGNEQPLPSDVRTPRSLVSTLNYLIDEVLAQQPLEKCHAFIRDRTRSIRQDFTLQNIRDVTAVQVHERIARFHILCLHEMCELDESKFSEQQETEQLRKVLLSLMEFYDDLREEGIETENEPEFRAYHMLSHIRDQDVVRQAQTLPVHIFRHPYMTRAIEFFGLAQRNNEIMETSSRRNKPENVEASQNFYSKFFKLIADPGTPFLMACMLECHFADIRKGALKAMNVSYMMKAGGVEAEHVRQVLAYDSLKHLLNEVALYGIPLDMSLDEPTICFGQKHYRTKTPIFVEPLSNPSQKKSIQLVEPKKNGQSFQSIIYGEQTHFERHQPIPFTSQPNVHQPISITNVFKPKAPVSASFTYSELTGEPAQFKKKDLVYSKQQQDKQRELEQLEGKVNAAEEAAAAQRKKLDALMAQKKQEEERKRKEAEQKQKEEEARRRQLEEEQERQRQEAEQERIRREQQIAAEKAKLEQLRREQRDQQVAAMHRQVVKSQLCNRWLNELMEKAIMDTAFERAKKSQKTQRFIQHHTQPWVHRVRQRIEKRNANALKRHRMWHFNACINGSNPYINTPVQTARPIHSTPEGIRMRVAQSLQAEAFALENVKISEDVQTTIWETQDFAISSIYPRIQNKMPIISSKPTWQLIINVADIHLDSSVWFSHKLGLDTEFNSRKQRYQAFDIVTRMVTPQLDLPSQWVDETGAVIFSLPEAPREQTQQQRQFYWNENKKRLDKLSNDLEKYFPGKRVPFLFTYFPDASCLESTLSNIPLSLGLNSNRTVSDYHILIMNKLTIVERFQDELNWLSNNTITNRFDM